MYNTIHSGGTSSQDPRGQEAAAQSTEQKSVDGRDIGYRVVRVCVCGGTPGAAGSPSRKWVFFSHEYDE
jgi:hypothetical protein